ncbi:hypothetical protein NNN67_12145, partial [Enterococcus faecium]|nr:hypothetical protein [Enterococcus faecium]MDT6699338.1 hypothetical protein [Enterococcus faecium]MDV4917157.1 hypothetical protein [Enterococcus faecium]
NNFCHSLTPKITLFTYEVGRRSNPELGYGTSTRTSPLELKSMRFTFRNDGRFIQLCVQSKFV